MKAMLLHNSAPIEHAPLTWAEHAPDPLPAPTEVRLRACSAVPRAAPISTSSTDTFPRKSGRSFLATRLSAWSM